MNSPSQPADNQQQEAEIEQIASHFVTARKQATPLADFPGTIPGDLAYSYRVQDHAIDLWSEALGGWKVGRIPLHLEDAMGIDRLAGPVFKNTIVTADSGALVETPMYVGGFGAIEAEYVAVIAEDAPADKLSWSTDEAAAMIADLRIGIEIASSPLATINELGPTVVASDFGNNLGLIVGPSISEWRTRDLKTMSSATTIDGQSVGDGGAFNLTGGFVRSVQFLLELMPRRGRPLRAGDMIATGQTTGIHDIMVGQTGVISFGDDGSLSVRMIPAQPLASS